MRSCLQVASLEDENVRLRERNRALEGATPVPGGALLSGAGSVRFLVPEASGASATLAPVSASGAAPDAH
jgi:hypothetical protein